MAHRLGNGQKVDNITAAMAEWRARGRSPSTYCSRQEHDAWVDDLGELMYTLPDGTEIRRHANIKCCTYRGGNPKIAYNRVLIGNPAVYAAWKARDTKAREEGLPLRDWMGEWTFYPDKDYEKVVRRALAKRDGD